MQKHHSFHGVTCSDKNFAEISQIQKQIQAFVIASSLIQMNVFLEVLYLLT